MQKLFSSITNHSYIFVILIIAFILRIVLLDQMPPSLNWDEVSHGYNAYSILETGKDEWGNSFPSIFRAYGDYKLPVYIYVTAVNVYLFGLNAFAVRLTSLIGGLFTVLFAYLLCLQLTKNKNVAAISAFLVALEPWTLFLSRGAFEANLALTFIVSGAYFLLKGLQKPVYLTVSLFLFGLSVWTYNSARVFVPILLLFLILLYRKELVKIYKMHKKVVALSLVPVALFFIPMVYQLINPVGQARYNKVAILDEGAIYQIEQLRTNTELSPLVSKFMYNRYTFFTWQFIQNVGKHYSPDYLFINGGSQYQFSVPNHGVLYWITLPFLLLGIILLLKKHDKSSFFILFWFIVGSFASSITREAPHVLRSVTMLPTPMIISAIGFVAFVKWSEKVLGKRMIIDRIYKISKKDKVEVAAPRQFALYIAFILFSFLSSENYITHYFNDYKNNYSWSWQYGYKEAVEYTKMYGDRYDHIIVTKKYGEPHEFFLFYNKWNPEDYRSDPRLIRYAQSDWFWVDRFHNYWFINDWQVRERETTNEFVTERGVTIPCNPKLERCLLITSPGNAPLGWSNIETIRFLDGKPAFEIYEN